MNTLVYLGAYNGERFIQSQINSILAQFARVDLVISDDGSTDSTEALVHACQASNSNVYLVQGPRNGFGANFLSVFTRSDIDLGRYQFIAFSDQDDVWDRDHLNHAIAALLQIRGPAVFGSKTRWVDTELQELGHSSRIGRELHFANALIESFAGGNTMVLNAEAVGLLRRLLTKVQFTQKLSHDWLIYQIISGVGGRVLFSNTSRVAYRQHDGNFLGENRSFRARFTRFELLIRGEFRSRVDHHVALLDQVKLSLTERNRLVFAEFQNARNKNGLARLIWFCRSPLRRESYLETMLFALFFALGLV